MRFDLEKLRNRDAPGTFQTAIGEKFALLIDLRDDDRGIDSMITIYNTAVTDTASEILEKECRRKSPELPEMSSTSHQRGDLKKRWYG